MKKFMLIVASLVLTMFLAREAKAQHTPYDYTYYVSANTYVCAVRAPFGEVHITHDHPVSYHMCRQHYRFFIYLRRPHDFLKEKVVICVINPKQSLG